MNVLFDSAVANLPLGIAVTLEFLARGRSTVRNRRRGGHVQPD